MTKPKGLGESPRLNSSDWGFEGARRFQTLLGLELTPGERFQWLEEMLAEMRQLCGLARNGQAIGDQNRKTPE